MPSNFQHFSHRITSIKGPVFHDCCDHPAGSYVGTVSFFDRDRRKALDVYLFPSHREGCPPEVCLRYGNECHEYISPGGLFDFLCSARTLPSPEYTNALALIDEKFCFSAARR